MGRTYGGVAKKVTPLLLLGILFAPALGQAQGEGYGYPIPGSYEATIMGTPHELKPELPKEFRTRELVLEPNPGLRKPDIFFYDHGLRCTLFHQEKKAPLAFLIAGTGSNYKAPRLVTMAKLLYKGGFHVITLTSPTYPSFIINASTSHIPGDLVEDAADLYRVMETAWNQVKGDIEVSDFYLSGYSLGGTQSAFVAKLDEERKTFNFRKVLMINPAVNLHSSISRIESLLDGIPGGPKAIGSFFNKMLNKFVEFYREGDFIDISNDFLYAVYKSHLLTTDEAGGLIALSFRINSAGMIFASDVMTNGGYIVPKNRVLTTADSLSDYFRVGVHLSFLDYFDEYFYPHFEQRRPGLTRQALIDAQGLRSIEGYLKSTTKIGVMTNENDLILAPGDLDYLRGVFGDRAKVYPIGGHLGNLEYRDNMAYLADFVGVLEGEGGGAK